MKEAPFVAVTETPCATAAGVAAAGRFTPCTFGSVGPPNFQAAITSAVRITIAVTAIAASLDSRRWRGRWRRPPAGTRRVSSGDSSSPAT